MPYLFVSRRFMNALPVCLIFSTVFSRQSPQAEIHECLTGLPDILDGLQSPESQAIREICLRSA